MKNIIKVFVLTFAVIQFSGCYDRSIVDSKSFGFSLPDVENLNYTRKGKVVTLTWEIPSDISADFQRPVQVSIQIVENNIYRNIVVVSEENTSANIAIDKSKSYRFVVKLLGTLTNDAKIEGKTNRVYSKGMVLELPFPFDDSNDGNKFELTRPVLIDFGRVDIAGPPYNVFTDGSAGSLLLDLKDDKGTNTGFSIAVASYSSFVDDNAQSNPNIFGFPWQASNDKFMRDGVVAEYSDLILSNLNKNQSYSFYFYGSIDIGERTQTKYHVIGDNEGWDYLDTSFNIDKIAFVANITPNDDGEIIVRLSIGPENVFYWQNYNISVMIIIPNGYNLQFPLVY